MCAKINTFIVEKEASSINGDQFGTNSIHL